MGQQMSLFCKMLLRPPRCTYPPSRLGPKRFVFEQVAGCPGTVLPRGRLVPENSGVDGSVYERRDLQLRGPRGKLLCSHFLPAASPDAPRPCVLYLHGNCGCRIESLDILDSLLPRNISVFSLDTSGAGLSEGEYISLGHHEQEDVRLVLRYLRSLDSITSIAIWGRSMGAVTGIFVTATDPDIAACVLDSPFADLRTVAEELFTLQFNVPRVLFDAAFEMVRQEAMYSAGVDPAKLCPLRAAPRAMAPAFFGVAIDDTTVSSHHTYYLRSAWGGETSLRVYTGGHNGQRPLWFLSEATRFLQQKLVEKAEEMQLHRLPSQDTLHVEVESLDDMDPCRFHAWNNFQEDREVVAPELEEIPPLCVEPRRLLSPPIIPKMSMSDSVTIGKGTFDMSDPEVDIETIGAPSTTPSETTECQDESFSADSDIGPRVPATVAFYAKIGLNEEAELAEGSTLAESIAYDLAKIGFDTRESLGVAVECDSTEEALERLLTKDDALMRLCEMETSLPEDPHIGMSIGLDMQRAAASCVSVPHLSEATCGFDVWCSGVSGCGPSRGSQTWAPPPEEINTIVVEPERVLQGLLVANGLPDASLKDQLKSLGFDPQVCQAAAAQAPFHGSGGSTAWSRNTSAGSFSGLVEL
eukprot:TRINITY_DN11995_c0_g1_i1.p1 TRINITY_DN11995_c0_g1~~TRINITY_DN11995_c0_g1_i1.p1  ORF type:complete len:639 (-),score=109.71 TRINITY_DN11995_c0_g1_i1:88-2004(-)